MTSSGCTMKTNKESNDTYTTRKVSISDENYYDRR